MEEEEFNKMIHRDAESFRSKKIYELLTSRNPSDVGRYILNRWSEMFIIIKTHKPKPL